MKKYEIYESKTKIMLLGFLTLGVFIFLSFILMMKITGTAEMDALTFIVILIGDILVLFVLIFALPKKLKNKKPTLILSEKGIAGIFHSETIIPWEDIEGFLYYRYQHQLLLGILLKDQEKYINKITPFQQKLANINTKMGLPAFNINIRTLKEKPEELFVKLSEFGAEIMIRQ